MPTLQTLVSKSAGAGEQGGVLGVTQSVASLARTVGPTLAAWLIYSAMVNYGADGRPHNLSDTSLYRTFWVAAAIMFTGFLLDLYFARAHAAEYRHSEAAEATGD